MLWVNFINHIKIAKMKRTLFFIIALVFIASLSFSQTKVNINNLEEYGGAMFKIDDIIKGDEVAELVEEN